MRSNAMWPRPTRSSIYQSLFLVVLAIGLCCVAGYLLLKSVTAVRTGVAVSGTVTEHYQSTKKGQKTWNSKVAFTLPDGRIDTLTWKGKREMGSALDALAVPEGSSYYLTQKDGMNLWGGPIFVSLFAGGTLLMGLYALKRSKARIAEINWLIDSGSEQSVTVTGVRKVVSKTKKRTRRSWFVQAKSDSGLSYESERLRSDPGNEIVGRTVSILVDPNNPNSYYFPKSSL